MFVGGIDEITVPELQLDQPFDLSCYSGNGHELVLDTVKIA